MSGTITIDVVSVRRISAPPHTDYDYIATIRAGNQTFLTTPARIVANAFAGQTLTFRQQIDIRLNSSYDARRGIVVSVGSTCGKVQFGVASCSQSREWSQLSKPRGEVQVVFTQRWDAPSLAEGSRTRLQRPQSASLRPPRHFSDASSSSLPPYGQSKTTDSYSLSPPQPQMMSTSATSARQKTKSTPKVLVPLTVRFLSIELDSLAMTLDSPEVSIFFSVDFAQQTQQTAVKLCPFKKNGFSGCWADGILEFDVPVAVIDRNARIRLCHGTNPSDAKVLGECHVSLGRLVDSGDSASAFTARLPECPGCKVTITAQATHHEPLREGRNGRPKSAFTRRSLNEVDAPTLPMVTFAADVKTPQKRDSGQHLLRPYSPDTNSSEGEYERFKSDSSADINLDDPSETRSQQHGNHSLQQSEKSAAMRLAEEAEVERTLDAVAGALKAALERALSPVMLRLTKLEQRISRNEEAVTQVLRSRSTFHSGTPAGLPLSSTSRPSSAESGAMSTASGPGRLAVTTEELQERFAEYDVLESGFMTSQQLLDFYRSSYSFASDESEDSILQTLSGMCKGLSEDRVTFDDFCRVALRLAKA